ncbi:MAG: phosphatase PAP2 family protein [Elusimicrobia bacterium]|nr:phosphatase PAP2 family protein [Elusimicrobiota bacterium]
MISPLVALGGADRWLLLKVNRAWSGPALDAVLPVITDLQKRAWFVYGAAPAAAALWLWKGKRRALRVLVVAALAVGASDMIAYRVIKPLVARPRPTVAGVPVIQRAPIGGRYGFPSNHASNVATAASVLSVAYPPLTWAFAAAAFAIGYSRVYVGAHYPGDVLAGFLLGILLGWPWGVLMLGGGKGGGGPGRRRR